MSLAAPFAGVRQVSERHAIPAPAIHLKNSAGRHGGDKRQVVARRRQHVVQPVEAPAYIRESEIAEQTLSNARTLQRGESRVLGRHFAAVQELEPPHLQRLALIAPQAVQAEIELLRKD